MTANEWDADTKVEEGACQWCFEPATMSAQLEKQSGSKYVKLAKMVLVCDKHYQMVVDNRAAAEAAKEKAKVAVPREARYAPES